MNMGNRFFVLFSIVVVLVLLAACGAPQPTETMAPTETNAEIIVTFDGDECAYEGPDKVPAGRIDFVLDVEDQKDHLEYGLAVLTLDEGKTFEDLDAWSSTNQPPWTHLHGLLEEIPQDSQARTTVTALEGPLFVVCFTAYPITKVDTLGPIEVEATASQ